MKIGDTVTIYKPFHIKTGVNQIQWRDDMDRFIGKTEKITKRSTNSIGIIIYTVKDCGGWSWREEWLEDPLLKLINEVTK